MPETAAGFRGQEFGQGPRRKIAGGGTLRRSRGRTGKARVDCAVEFVPGPGFGLCGQANQPRRRWFHERASAAMGALSRPLARRLRAHFRFDLFLDFLDKVRGDLPPFAQFLRRRLTVSG